MRALGVRMKLNPLRENIAGKRLVVVDDSIVRGTTQKQLVADAARGGRPRGPPPDHVAARTSGRASTAWTPATAASCSPPTSTVDEIRDYLDVDSLAYLDLDRLVDATGAPGPASAPPASPATTRSRCRSTLHKGVLEPERPGTAGRGTAPPSTSRSWCRAD